MFVSFTDENEPVIQPLMLEFGSDFAFHDCTLRILRHAVQTTERYCRNAPFWSKRRISILPYHCCFWCHNSNLLTTTRPACPVQSELSNVLRLVEWWNGLPASGDNPTTLSFDFRDDTISALNRVTTLHPVLWPSFYERLGDTSGWVAHNEFVKLGQLMVRCSVLSRAFIYGALQALERSKYHARVLWQNAIKCMLFEYLLAVDDSGAAAQDVDYQVMELEIRLDCVWRQMAAHGNLLSEPTRGALERINKLPSPLWRQYIRAMINLYLTEPGNPPQLLVSALNIIGEFEQQEQCTLLTLAVWKAQCVSACESLLPAVRKDDRVTASFDDRQWTACKQEQWDSNAMTVIVPLVRSFLGPPPRLYQFGWINNADVTTVNPGVWWEVIAMEARQKSPSNEE